MANILFDRVQRDAVYELRDCIEKGATHTTDEEKIVLLHMASFYDSVECLTYMIMSFGKEYINKKYGGYTLLHEAVVHDSAESLKILLMNGADINAQEDYNHKGTALHSAARYSSMECIYILLDHGADISVLDITNKTFLDSISCSSLKKKLKDYIKKINLNGRVIGM